MPRLTRTIPAALAVATLAIGGLAPSAFARHGADDPVGHNAGDDHGQHHGGKARAARHGADDGPGHVRHGGNDDGPNHS